VTKKVLPNRASRPSDEDVALFEGVVRQRILIDNATGHHRPINATILNVCYPKKPNVLQTGIR
jgi:hypothetical protein